MNRQNITINFVNGSTHELALRLFDTMQAERHLRSKGLGTPQDSAITFLAYACYIHMRRDGKVDGQSFEDWCDTVVDIQAEDTEQADPLA